MIRATVAALLVLMAVVAVAQTSSKPGEVRAPQPILIPEIPAGADPMERQPDPAAGTPAAKPLRQPGARGDASAGCRVQRADTDTGFVVVCEEGG